MSKKTLSIAEHVAEIARALVSDEDLRSILFCEALTEASERRELRTAKETLGRLEELKGYLDELEHEGS